MGSNFINFANRVGGIKVVIKNSCSIRSLYYRSIYISYCNCIINNIGMFRSLEININHKIKVKTLGIC